MAFTIRPPKVKVQGRACSIKLPLPVAEQIKKLALAKNTSFNRVVVQMIKYCLADMDAPTPAETAKRPAKG